MSWDSVILSSYQAGDSLYSQVVRLFACQRQDWPMFAKGEAALRAINKEFLLLEGEQVVVQSNPGRRKSTHAKTDVKSIAQRTCFLCPENMPAEERGIAFGQLVILPNPYPILSLHCTIPHREHQPQRIGGQIGSMLDLARCLGSEMAVFYNGPRCGASAPDHFHFQACLANEIPVCKQIVTEPQGQANKVLNSFGRRFLCLFENDASSMQSKLERCIQVLNDFMDESEEAMLNLIIRASDDSFQAFLFPRAAHRPSCYFAEGTRQLAISPAALEMAGVLVVADPEHFQRVSTEVVREIYTEVSLDATRFDQFVEAIR